MPRSSCPVVAYVVDLHCSPLHPRAHPLQQDRSSEAHKKTSTCRGPALFHYMAYQTGMYMWQVHNMAYQMAKAVGDRTRAARHMEQTWECAVLAWGSSAPLVASYAAKMQVSFSQPLFVSVCVSVCVRVCVSVGLSHIPPTYFSLSLFLVFLCHTTHMWL